MENEEILKKIKKKSKIYKILPFLDKYNPYRKDWTEDDNLLESKWMLIYRAFFQWVMDVIVNGFVLNFIFAIFLGQPIHIFIILAYGLGLWVVYKLAGDLKDGLKELVRSMPK